MDIMVESAVNSMPHLAKEEGSGGGTAAAEHRLELLLAHVRRLAVDRLRMEKRRRKVERIRAETFLHIERFNEEEKGPDLLILKIVG